jgi:membrane-associated progesterone receptor component
MSEEKKLKMNVMQSSLFKLAEDRELMLGIIHLQESGNLDPNDEKQNDYFFSQIKKLIELKPNSNEYNETKNKFINYCKFYDKEKGEVYEEIKTEKEVEKVNDDMNFLEKFFLSPKVIDDKIYKIQKVEEKTSKEEIKSENEKIPEENKNTPKIENEKIPEENKKIEEIKVFTKEELSNYDGIKESKIYISLKGKIYDVTEKKEMYSKGGELEKYAGKDVTYSLAKNILECEDVEYKIEDFNEKETKAMNGWENYYQGKYKIVGILDTLNLSNFEKENLFLEINKINSTIPTEKSECLIS